MPTTPDLAPAADRMAALLAGIGDDADLQAPTPCSAYTLGDLLDHVGGLTIAFTAAAQKASLPASDQNPTGDASRLGDDWRPRITADLQRLVDAWRQPEAWTGMTQAGPVELPGEVAGAVAMNELVVHGWDVAKASGQPYEVDDDTLAACHGFVSQFSGPGSEEMRGDAFGPVVEVPDGAPFLDRVIGLNGRRPDWTPA